MSESELNTSASHSSPIPPQVSYLGPPNSVAQPGSRGKAIASMVLGICSIITFMFYGVPSLILGILAVIFSKHAMTNVRIGTAPQSSIGMAKAGKVCGWIGIILSVLVVIGFLIIFMIFIAISLAL